LAEDYRARLGPIARREMLGLDNQTNRFRRSLDRIFSGLDTEPFLGALDEVLSLFSQSTSTGRALKAIVEALFQPLISESATAGPVVKRFFQSIVIAALQLTIAILRLRVWMKETFGARQFLPAQFLINSMTLGTMRFAGELQKAATLFGMLLEAYDGFVLAMRRGDMAKVAKEAISGFVLGIRQGAEEAATEIENFAGAIATRFENALGISSPSRVFADYGSNIAAGAARGIEAGAPMAQDAADALAPTPADALIPTPGATSASTPGGERGGRSVSISIGDVIVNAGETNNPRELATALRDELAAILEGVNIELGVTS